LIFDEYPYKTYSAKVTGQASLKHIVFELEEGRVYRGEGTIQFTCYYPYAHSTHTDKMLGGVIGSAATKNLNYSYRQKDQKFVLQGSNKQTLPCGLML
jgi:phage-related protein